MVERGENVVASVVIFGAEKYATFSNFIFRCLSQFDGAVERGLNGGEVGGCGTGPCDGDSGEGLGDEEAIP